MSASASVADVADEGAAGDPSLEARVAALDRAALERDLDAEGCAVVPSLLNAAQCAALSASYADDAHFRARIDMTRHGFGRGEYKYFAYPLPEPIATLRGALYAHLQPIANRWADAFGHARRFPATHAQFLAECRAHGQARPTPLLLRYRAGDYNRLHQDVYGERVFPLQAAVLLSAPGHDFEGGEFVLTEQRARMQSRAEVVPLRQGDAVVFAVRERPLAGVRGVQRLLMRHGVSRLRSGRRDVAGIVFHDAQ